MFSADELLRLQQEQFRHDRRNHFEILALHKTDRLKHYGLHFGKYAGRLARGTRETKSPHQTVVDAALVCLSAANALHQQLDAAPLTIVIQDAGLDATAMLTDAAGRFCDACEKVDHMEEFIEMARTANADIMLWAVQQATIGAIDLRGMIDQRRAALAQRQFFVVD